ncbi:hypothetical protein DEO72_LG1g2196 [Vigna unguiculata]|uniref:Uncharacterized protein n=1 Tax=Vigna unguiculata TaxID=3917 RepID=A0A4D6KPF6_VIGUN|nr:hypothetical protein DEO72_LG1g2196 [Vigna unguiculata]
MQSNIFSSSHPYSNQTGYDSSFNTLRLDSTHPDTYNSVGFSGCLHLWWIPLLDPELLDPELCVTSVTMNQNLSHHKHCLAQRLAQAEGSRSGETCSLRRASLSLGRGYKNKGHEQHGISLKRDPSRLGELPARSKVERAAWATFRAKALGELPVSSRLGEVDSLGRD